ncbi:hypothetical protein POM88_029817 [Heracleum sosnowskyi]|uniref:Uncharacterized protein n=1 Tax=Heracleum sosnowskyi TaxID=360622 RepID=A0AAD8MI46_9APIA|nr:hypothetical protein POM88_029817 [Heracleum sosnowskyi]
MATTLFHSVGLEFVPNNYAAPLSTENAPEAFHLFQNFLVQSDIGYALVEPAKLSGLQIKAFWETGVYDDRGESGTPSTVFEFEEQEFVVTPTTVRDALGFEDFNAYTISVGDAELQRMMREIGYTGSLARTGNLKRPLLRKEWSFFFDSITRAFGKKCTNWDAIPIDSLQIGYSLLYVNKDVKKGNVGDLLLPERVQQFLQPQPQQNPEPLNTESLNTEPTSTSQRPKAGGRTKHRAFKAVKAAKPSNADDLPRKLVAANLFDGLVPDSTPVATPEIVSEDVHENATVPDEARANVDVLPSNNLL